LTALAADEPPKAAAPKITTGPRGHGDEQRAITAARVAKRDAEIGKVAKCVKGATAPGCEP
jgi:hypothetical protein